MARFDWPGLLRAGLAPVAQGGAGLRPAQFWALTPIELQLMLARAGTGAGFGRAQLAALMAAYPDHRAGDSDAGERDQQSE